MKGDIVIELDFVCPSDNHRNGWGRGRSFPKKEYTEFLGLMAQWWARNRGTKLLGYWEVRLEITWQDRRRRDANNLIKTVCDALERAGAFEDDKRTQGHIDATHYPGEGGRKTGMIITLRPAKAGTYPQEV